MGGKTGAKLNELVPKDIGVVREIPSSEVRILWANDFYDLPISGMAESGGRRFRFEMVDRCRLGRRERYRAFWLISLDSEQLMEEEKWQDLFCNMVGAHFDYTGRPGSVYNEADAHEYYRLCSEAPRPDYGGNAVIGWFRL